MQPGLMKMIKQRFLVDEKCLYRWGVCKFAISVNPLSAKKLDGDLLMDGGGTSENGEGKRPIAGPSDQDR